MGKKVPAYQHQERYELIWVALQEPIYALPEIPELENDTWKIVNTGPFTWRSDASCQVENFTDFGHFPWVHPGLLGDPERPIVADYTVEFAITCCTTQSCVPKRPTRMTFPSSPTNRAPARAPQPLRAASALRDCAAPGLGW